LDFFGFEVKMANLGQIVKTVCNLHQIKKSDIAKLCPDISETTIERTLKELLEAGYLEKVGKGRATGYVKK
jgi:Fic family protein